MHSEGIPLYELRQRLVPPDHPEGRVEVWCPLRKRWIVLTPEEHVRQCLIRWLHEEKAVPLGLMSVERGLKYDRLQKRYDLLVYGREGQPQLLTECKAPYVEMGQDTLMQAATYNSRIQAGRLALVNGPTALFFVWNRESEKFEREAALPVFDDW